MSDQHTTATVKDFTIFVKNKGEDRIWEERYQKPTRDPLQWSIELVQYFNDTRQRPDAPEREVVRVEVHGDVDPVEHAWGKTSLVTQYRAGSAFDIMKCDRCGIFGKRYRLNEFVKRDNKFSAQVYARCDTAMAHFKKLRAAGK